MRNIREWLLREAPRLALDCGCGCGRFTRSIASCCGRIVAIDPIASIGSCIRDQPGDPGIEFCRMDGRRMGFRAGSFPIVWERASLHHVREWRGVLAEMFRVSAGAVLIEEPLDSDRTHSHRRTIEAQRLFLELQHEVGYQHFPPLEAGELCRAVESAGTVEFREITRRDEPVGFDDFFEGFERFAARSARRGYWMDRLAGFRAGLRGEPLCQEDFLFVAARAWPAAGNPRPPEASETPAATSGFASACGVAPARGAVLQQPATARRAGASP